MFDSPTALIPGLQRWAAGAGVLALACAVVQMAVEVVAVAILRIPVPGDVEGWLRLLTTHRLIAVVELTALQIPLFALLTIVLLGLAASLWRAAPTPTVIFTAVGLLGIAVYLAANTALGLTGLSDGYAAARSDAERAATVAAATALMAHYEGSGLDVGSVLVLAAVVGLSAIMWRSGRWGTLAPFSGILAGGVSAFYYVATPLGATRIFLLEGGSAVFLVWLLLVTLGLRRDTAA